MVHLPLFNRRMENAPWTRYPSDLWFPAEGWIIPFGLAVQIPFSLSFLAGWWLYFPTPIESLIWRICSVFHAAFSVTDALYYMFGSMHGTATRVIDIKRQALRAAQLDAQPSNGSYSPPPNAADGVKSGNIVLEAIPVSSRAEKGTRSRIFAKSVMRFQARLNSRKF